MVILSTLPSSFVVIHGPLVTPPPITDHVVNGCFIAKTIRHIHNAELARQLIVLINETFKDSLVAPSHSTLMKILSLMKSTRGRVNSCIDATQDAERKGTLFLKCLWSLCL